MPRDSNGIYSLPEGYEAETGQTIEASQHNPPLEDIASALTLSLPRNGTAAMTGNLPMGGNKVTGLGTPTANTDAATKAYVDSATSFDPSAYVAMTGDQTISGVKTFNSIPVGPSSDPASANQLTRKSYVDAQVATKANDSAVVHNTGAETVAGVKTFSSIPVLPASDPTLDNQAARKSYVDARQPIPSSSSFAIGSLLLAINRTSAITDGTETAGTNLRVLTFEEVDGVTTEFSFENNMAQIKNGGALAGTWKNVSGATIEADGAGYFVRTA